MPDQLSKITLPKDADEKTIVDRVNDQGIALLPDYFSSEIIASLNLEFDDFIANARKNNDPSLLLRDELVALPVIRNKIDASRFPTTAMVFGDEKMRTISVSYLGTPDIGLNHQIYVNLNLSTTSRVDKLPFLAHFDKISVFKFFVYLTDTNMENGAMGVLPGTQHENRHIRMEAHDQLSHTTEIPNVISDVELIPIEAKAGSMFIFDTDVTHAAGFVQNGSQRRIMRGHTRTVENLKSLGLADQALEG